MAVGLGLGGMLACRAAEAGAPIDGLVLWASPARGRELTRQLKAFARLEASQVFEGLPDPPPPAEGEIEVGGFVLSAATQSELGEVDLSALTLPHGLPRGALLLERDGIGVDERLREALERQERARRGAPRRRLRRDDLAPAAEPDARGRGDRGDGVAPGGARGEDATTARRPRHRGRRRGPAPTPPIPSPSPQRRRFAIGDAEIVETPVTIPQDVREPVGHPHRARGGPPAGVHRHAQRRRDPPHRPQPHVGGGRAAVGGPGRAHHCASTWRRSARPTARCRPTPTTTRSTSTS